MNYSHNIHLLEQLLPFILELRGKTVVIKYGGAAMINQRLTARVTKEIALLAHFGIKVIVVHGGGPFINDWLKKFQIDPSFQDGIRVTDPLTMDVVQMVLAGKVNKDLVALISKEKIKALGISGKDANILLADPLCTSPSNRVANVKKVDVELLTLLTAHRYIPVIAPIASDSDGLSYNVNADIAAAEIASAVDAESLLLLTDTPGIFINPDNASNAVESLTVDQTANLIDKGIISGGMLPKVSSCISALSRGVNSAYIIDGRMSYSILLTLLTNATIGTCIVR
uniref:Acetylglutamate kinase n=1 Tax=Scinaia undulata TaxID=1884664 RepID=A0A1G4NXT6_9FLOR|nr:Acetylglutamate kinase [Scinaia undulata]SCW23467.1 Acetylglutamate kinase [Scinaia undulata]